MAQDGLSKRCLTVVCLCACNLCHFVAIFLTMRSYIQIARNAFPFPLVVEPHETIANVKVQIGMMVGWALEVQILSYCDWQL